MVPIKSPLRILAYLAALAGVAPLYPYLDPVAMLVFPGALAAGLLCDHRGRYPLRGAGATVVSLALFFVYLLQIRLDNLIGPVGNLLVLLLAVRLVSEKSGRHFLQIYLLAIFALAGSTLHTLGLAFLPCLFILVTLVAVSLVLLSFFTIDPELSLPAGELRRILGFSLVLPAVSLVLMVFFFFILPRTQTPLWNFLNPRQEAQIGFSDKVSPGSFAAIAGEKSLAFRVETEELATEDLYWRGIVLNRVEGSTWSRDPNLPVEAVLPQGGRRVAQTVFPEPGKSEYLFALDLPVSIELARVSGSPDQVFRSRRALERRLQYRAESLTGGSLVGKGPRDRAFYLQVSPELSPRVVALAERIKREGTGDSERVGLLENFFVTQGVRYSNSDLPRPEDPVDDFLFEGRAGYCEHFASSFALVLRLAGVPSRLVGGFYGGEYNELGGYYLVTDDMAHVWVEVWLEGRGWVRRDPSTLAINAGSLLGGRGSSLGAWRRLSDAVLHHWNRAVINYDLEQQIEVFRETGRRLKGVKAPEVDGKKLVWAAGLVLLFLVAVAGLRGWRPSSTEERLLRRFLREVARRYGLETIPADRGLSELAEQVDDPACREFARIYGGAVFRDRRPSREEMSRLRELVREVGRNR